MLHQYPELETFLCSLAALLQNVHKPCSARFRKCIWDDPMVASNGFPSQSGETPNRNWKILKVSSGIELEVGAQQFPLHSSPHASVQHSASAVAAVDAFQRKSDAAVQLRRGAFAVHVETWKNGRLIYYGIMLEKQWLVIINNGYMIANIGSIQFTLVGRKSLVHLAYPFPQEDFHGRAWRPAPLGIGFLAWPWPGAPDRQTGR